MNDPTYCPECGSKSVWLATVESGVYEVYECGHGHRFTYGDWWLSRQGQPLPADEYDYSPPAVGDSDAGRQMYGDGGE